MAERHPRQRRRTAASAPLGSGDAYAMLFERNPMPLFVFDRETLGFLAVNDAALALYGYDRGRFLASSLIDLVTPEERPQFAERMPRAEDGRAALGVCRHMRSDRRVVYVDLLRQEFEFRGRPAALISARDVTGKLSAQDELRQSHERLLRSEEQLARAQRVSHTGSFFRDLRSGTVEWSDETFRIFDRPREAGTPGHGRSNRAALLALFHPDDRAKYAAVMDAAEKGQSTPPIEVRIPRPDGTVRWIHHESEVVIGDDGKPACRIGTYRDVTEAHEAAAEQERLRDALAAAHRELRIANEDLERRVEERTAELGAAQDELLKKERLSIIGQLTASVAHDLRNPLSSIRNTLFAMRETAAKDNAPFERMAARIERSVERCDAIIADLLDFTRVRALSPSRAKLDDWLDEVLSEQKLAPGIVLERALACDGAAVMLDCDRFRRVIVNLIDNATQAMDGGRDERRIRVATSAGEVALIVISDTGPGIAPDILPRVFDPLFSTKPSGTGLGLPTVKQIVEQHGGRIVLSSEMGAGTVVRISLPLAAAALAA
jgi:PAS domain S-box-containing protein